MDRIKNDAFWLCEHLKSNKIENDINLIKYIKNLIGNNTVVNYEKKENKISRIIVSKSKNKQINGAVIDCDKWIVLSNMPIEPQNIKLKQMYYDYNPPKKIYKINDGTTVSLYYYNDKWNISTYKCYDISDNIWLCNKSYKDLLTEVLNKYEDFSYDKLDKQKYYIIGFRNHNLHPLLYDEEKAWVIGIYSRNIQILTDNIGIPNQIEIELDNFDTISENIRQSLDNALEGTINYGYIMKQNGMIFIHTSPLYCYIKNRIYNIPKNNNRLQLTTPNQRVNYITMRAYLSSDNDYFIKLFPQYIDKWNIYDQYINDVTVGVIEKLHNLEISINVDQNIINKIYNNICTFGVFNTNSSGYDKIIKDFCTDFIYISLYIYDIDNYISKKYK